VSATNTEVGPESRTHRRNWFPWSGRHDLRHPTVKASHDDRTFGERVADDVARFGGSWPFIFLFLGLVFGWMVLNTVVLARLIHGKQWDPYPYIALNLMLSGLAGIQAPIIMMSQNRAAARDEALAGHHYAEAQKGEQMLVLLRRLLEANTSLTQQVHDLAVQIHQVVTPKGS
jgi:uncharacterized membrane protein